MKFTQKILTAIAVLGLAVSALAQGSFDFFAAPKTLVITPPTVLTESGGTTLLTTNTVNVSKFIGICALDICVSSNACSGPATNSFVLYTSPDGVTLTAVTNAALATYTTINSTNYTGTTNSTFTKTTQYYQVPGTLVSPTSSVSFFTGQYTTPATFTTSVSGSTPAAGGIYTYGINTENLNTYLSIVWTTSGPSGTVATVSCVMRGRTRQGVYY